MKKLLGLCLSILFCGTALAAPQDVNHRSYTHRAPSHNGLWWQSKSHLYRDAFIVGYKAGTAHATGHLVDINKFPEEELTDGVDHFYHDFRNRSILVGDALNYIVEQLRGDPDDKLSAELHRMRAAATPAPAPDSDTAPTGVQ